VGGATRSHQRVELLGRFGEVGDRLPELDDGSSLILEPGCELGCLPGVIGDLTHIEVVRKLHDVRLDLTEVDDVAGCENQALLHRPAAVRGVARLVNCRLGQVVAPERYQRAQTLMVPDVILTTVRPIRPRHRLDEE
jgi:hypothetical protein